MEKEMRTTSSKCNTDIKEEKPLWNFRPSALSSSKYEKATPLQLLSEYVEDGLRASYKMYSSATLSSNGSSSSIRNIPPKPTSTNSKVCYLRTCQWNIHYLVDDMLTNIENDTIDMSHADKVATAIIDANPDVVTLNEFGYKGRHSSPSLEKLCIRLQFAGYIIYDLCDAMFPTAMASKLYTTNTNSFDLDSTRSAMHLTVHVPFTNNNDINEDTATVKQANNDSVPIKIYGTHLEDSDDLKGRYRLKEAKELIQYISNSHENSTEAKTEAATLIVGDFNQQRSCDYTEDEWENICKNKAKRSSPQDDGVATLLRDNGYQCCYDNISNHNGTVQKMKSSNEDSVSCNWNPSHPPPATHWSGTVIDYTYYKGTNISLVGLYVLPYNLSDHRMVVCDWKITR